ncbi:hypothetical protein [Sneathiella sp.]|jgi:hypothetical protein|uniref:hypothetical protein n=1 Tax=Sneathiella sp. TaxID=1964365 RepID=UPI0039E50B31
MSMGNDMIRLKERKERFWARRQKERSMHKEEKMDFSRDFQTLKDRKAARETLAAKRKAMHH